MFASSSRQLNRLPIGYFSTGICSLGGNIPSMRPRSSITIPLACRRTAPTIMFPFCSSYSARMFSCSASRSFWMMTCLAVWAAMRPKSLGVISSWTISPTRASFLINRARSSEMVSWVSPSPSTTCISAKTLISAVSGSILISTGPVCPKLFRDADAREVSIASIRIALETPFSRSMYSNTDNNSLFIFYPIRQAKRAGLAPTLSIFSNGL